MAALQQPTRALGTALFSSRFLIALRHETSTSSRPSLLLLLDAPLFPPPSTCSSRCSDDPACIAPSDAGGETCKLICEAMGDRSGVAGPVSITGGVVRTVPRPKQLSNSAVRCSSPVLSSSREPRLPRLPGNGWRAALLLQEADERFDTLVGILEPPPLVLLCPPQL